MLFDMDGTIIDSTEAIIKNWQRIGEEIGVDPDVILAASHGRRAIDVLRDIQPSHATWDYVCSRESLVPMEFGADAVEIPGARDLLAEVTRCDLPWCIVTSGSRALVTGWLHVLKLAFPKHLVTAEDVEVGKPDPSCYLLGATKLNLQQRSPSIVVFEDAPAGIRSATAAGFKVIALATTHTVEQLQSAGAHWIVRDMRSVTLRAWNETAGEVYLEISHILNA
ncbi:hypothetical protein E8E13_000820 [Curvularia kusanoi]|uniref:Uncharacterized protein n=1 Tax=Curvularia kusanoi TaxID=90978 RepID=A0A9P4W6R7_CURKU|nr:hypothetical protein E8E13_000820 [Curvularia kusanoi]